MQKKEKGGKYSNGQQRKYKGTLSHEEGVAWCKAALSY